MPRIRTSKPKTKPAAAAGIPIAAGQLWLHELRSKVFGNTRLLRVWVPANYDGSGGTPYPVLYLNDGQNLFEASTAFAGVHWQVGETASRLIAEQKIPPLIIVGIDNTKDRALEYIPYRTRDPKILNPKGCSYPNFMQSEVMPFVEERYPLLKGRANIGLGGSSLGGLITLYTQLAAPNVFGRLLVESPSLFAGKKKILDACRRALNWPQRMYLAMGTHELGNTEKDAKILAEFLELETTLREEGLNEQRLKVRIDEGASHSEMAWAARFPEALEYLYSSAVKG